MTHYLTIAEERARNRIRLTLGCLLVVVICAVAYNFWLINYWFHGCRYPGRDPIVEIDQLSSALNAYKEKNVEYPPCFADADLRVRRERFMRHLRVAFTNSNYGRTEADYLRLREAIRNEKHSDSQPYTFKNAKGETALLDLDTLDAAEALVFWLHGFPTPCTSNGTPISPIKTFGFNRDRDEPMRRDSSAREKPDAMRFRTEPYFDFKQDRLVDRDDDGWLEYVRNPEGDSAPHVYFDAATYKDSSHDSANFGTVRYPTDDKFAERWGVAVPYLETFDPVHPQTCRWKLPNTFQIIWSGHDNRYGPSLAPNERRLAEYPSGETWTTTDGRTFTPGKLTADEKDNLTNMGTSTIGEAMQQSGH